MILELIKTSVSGFLYRHPSGWYLTEMHIQVTPGEGFQNTHGQALLKINRKKNDDVCIWKSFPSGFDIPPDGEALQYSFQL